MGLNIASKEIKQALEASGIRDNKLIGRGKYSLVFDNGNSVLKLTTDQFPVDFRMYLGNACKTLTTIPRIHRITVGVGEYANTPLCLIEIEKLDKMAPGTPQRKLAMIIAKLQRDLNGDAVKESFHRVAELTCQKMSESEVLPYDWRSTFGILGRFAAGKHQLGCDFHLANFMVRPATGDLVLNDPFQDRTL